MTPDRPVGEDDLQALVDGRLSAADEAAVRASVEERPELAGRIAAYRAAREALRARLQFKIHEPLPARLRIRSLLANRRQLRRARAGRAATILLWLALGAVAGWLAGGLVNPDHAPPGLAFRGAYIAEEAIAAHRTFAVEVAHPVEVRASEEAHLSEWLANRLGRRLPIPNLGASGFRLLGGRILPAGQDVAAQLMFDDDSGARLTFYIRVGEPGEAPPEFLRQGDVQAFYWIDDGCGYVVSAAIDRERLLEAAQSVFRQLETATGKEG